MATFNPKTHTLQPFENKNGEIKSFIINNIFYHDTDLRNIIKTNHGKWLNKYKVFIFSTKHKDTLIKLGCSWSETPFNQDIDMTLLEPLEGMSYNNYIKKDSSESKMFVVTDFSSNQSKALSLIGNFQNYANGFLILKSNKYILDQLNCVNVDADDIVLV